MEAAGLARDPDLMRHGVPIDHHLGAIGELDVQHFARTAFQLGIGDARFQRPFDAIEGRLGQRFEIGLRGITPC